MIEKMSKKTYYIIAFIIVLFAIVVRTYGWPNLINDINCDEAMTALNANSIAKTGVDIYGTRYPIYFEGWLIRWSKCICNIYNINIYKNIWIFDIFS